MSTDPTPSEAAAGAKYGNSWSRSGSAERNSQPIASALAPLLSTSSSASRAPVILEVASGFGHQISAIAQQYPRCRFQPSEADAYPRSQIDKLCSSLPNVAKAEALDVLEQNDWTTLVHNISGEATPGASEDEGLFDGLIVCNFTHITPWKVTENLFRNLDPRLGYVTQQGYRSVLSRTRGWVAIYGAFNENGEYTSEGNRKFDEDVRQRNAEWGLRDVQGELVPLAERHGYELTDRIEMPAGNLFLIFRVRKE